MEGGKEAVGVVGVGWVGLVTATCFAELGHPVVALDILPEKVDALNRGEVTIHEPGLTDILARNRDRLTFTTSMDELLAAAKLLFCCVDTPPTYSGDADLSRVRAVVDQLPDGSGHALVMKSTVPSGTGDAIRRDKPDLRYVSCPEFLKEGSAIEDFMHPDRVVIGADAGSEEAADAVAALYEPLGGEMVRTDVASAEMIKLASNAFLATKISFINEIANVCEQTGADVTEVARGMGLDGRIGPQFLKAGIGYGGSCFLGEETLLVRTGGSAGRRVTFAALWAEAGGETGAVVEPIGLEVLSWVPGEESVEWMPVNALTARSYSGDTYLVRAGGDHVRVTADHPFIVSDDPDSGVLVRMLAHELAPGLQVPVLAACSSALQATEPPPLPATAAGLGTRRYPSDTRGYPVSARADDVADRRGAVDTVFPAVEWAPIDTAAVTPFAGHVYSLKVQGSQTVVVNDGLVVHQCFPKDVSALKQLAGNSGYHFQLLNSVIEVNELQKRRVVAKLQKHLGSLVDKRIALLGLAFKPDTDDMREASSLVLSARLQGEGASVCAYDPVAEAGAQSLLPSVEMCDSAASALEGADAAVLVTEWPEFAELDWASAARSMNTAVVIDGRNFLDAESVRAAGFTYEGIGRPNGSR
jgi:UDP-glucose 6-dehydrogenase